MTRRNLIFACVASCCLVALSKLPQAPKFHDTSNWVGAEYTPWRATNQMWWHNFSQYRDDISREVLIVKKALGFTTFRVFLHDLLWDTNPEGLIMHMSEFLSILESHGMRAGFVFFDDCWDHNQSNIFDGCVPKKGIHNGCWLASPQDNKRKNGFQQFEKYVTGVVSNFSQDARVAWWEIFNEPKKKDTWSLSLRDTAYKWAKAVNPVSPIISCWDDTNDTDIVDSHEYYVPSFVDNIKRNAVFQNPAKGGIITEMGCRWYQGNDHDAGSPLAAVNWLDALRRPGSGAPFVPGVMLSWEVMVGHSQTRWHWGDKEGAAEPAVPWCGFIYPDGTPVSYTEAAAIRRYMGGTDDFLFLDTFLNHSIEAVEAFMRLAPTWTCAVTDDLGCYDDHGRILPQSMGTPKPFTRETCSALGQDAGLSVCGGEYGEQCWCGQALPPISHKIDDSNCTMPCTGNASEMCGGPYKLNVFKYNCKQAGSQRSLEWQGWKPQNPPAEALYELSVWPELAGDLTVTAGGYNVTISIPSEAAGKPSMLVKEAADAGKQLGSVDVSSRLVVGSWNILRVLAEPERVRVWLNPSFADVTGGSVPVDEKVTPHAPAPLIDAAAKVQASGLGAVAAGGAWRIDYASVLPPTLFEAENEVTVLV